MNTKTKDVILRLLILVTVIVLAGCKRRATTSSVSPLQLQSPLQAVSPVSMAVPTGVATPSLLFGDDFDPAQAVLAADDMSDLFNTTYNIAQPYHRNGMRGVQVVYPTRVIEHTSGFVEGFATQIEIYDQFADAVEAYRAAVADRDGETLEMEMMGDESRAFKTLSDMQGIYVWEVIIRKSNALAIIMIKSPEPVQAAMLEQIAGTVVGRLTP